MVALMLVCASVAVGDAPAPTAANTYPLGQNHIQARYKIWHKQQLTL